jgi:hypothetical protein
MHWQSRSGIAQVDEGIREQVVPGPEVNAALTDEEKKERIDSIFREGEYALSNFVVDLESTRTSWRQEERAGSQDGAVSWEGLLQSCEIDGEAGWPRTWWRFIRRAGSQTSSP